jgi:hypothetical protein
MWNGRFKPEKAVAGNVLVRFLARDDAKQAARAAALIRANEIWFSKMVLCATTAEARRVLSRRHRRDFMNKWPPILCIQGVAPPWIVPASATAGAPNNIRAVLR